VVSEFIERRSPLNLKAEIHSRAQALRPYKGSGFYVGVKNTKIQLFVKVLIGFVMIIFRLFL
jgi:hypothetical protein